MEMGMKSLKWEGIGTKNLFPHTSNIKEQNAVTSALMDKERVNLLLFYCAFSQIPLTLARLSDMFKVWLKHIGLHGFCWKFHSLPTVTRIATVEI